MSRPVIRWATRADLDVFFGEVGLTVDARCAELDGEIIAVWGLADYGGRLVLFMSIEPEARRYKVTMVREGKRIMERVRQSGRQFVYAHAEEGEPMAEKWLRSLGFEPMEGGGFRWQR